MGRGKLSTLKQKMLKGEFDPDDPMGLIGVGLKGFLPSFEVGMAESYLLGADELGEAGAVHDEMPALTMQQAHPFELAELGRNGLPGGPDQVGQIFVGQVEGDQGSCGSLVAVLLAQLEEDLRQPVVGPGVAELG